MGGCLGGAHYNLPVLFCFSTVSSTAPFVYVCMHCVCICSVIPIRLSQDAATHVLIIIARVNLTE